ncbi:hypothetical protein ACIBL3_43030 [Kribbella sp. NPDC050124]
MVSELAGGRAQGAAVLRDLPPPWPYSATCRRRGRTPRPAAAVSVTAGAS